MGTTKPTNYYRLLEVHPQARQEVIHRAYLELQKVYLPQGLTNNGNEAISRSLNEAYAVLNDPIKRREYDKMLSEDLNIQGTIGNYELRKFIAEGAVGRTYIAEHKLVHEKVCIKQAIKISPEAEQLFIDEAKTVWDLRHYALPAMRDLIRGEDGSVSIVMSYIEGPTLLEVIEKVGRLEAEHVAWIMERVLNALSYMHRHGVIHADIKPNNLIIQPKSHMAVLVDFGLGMKNPNGSSIVRGYTKYFAPPEAEQNLPPIPEYDLYSLGITMLYALSGDLNIAKNRQIPRDVPEQLSKFIKSLVIQNPMDRASWRKEDLCETISRVRVDAFGTAHSNFKSIPGF